MRTPEVEKAISNTKAGMYCTDDADTLAAEVERLEAELSQANVAAKAGMYAHDERTFLAECAEKQEQRAETAEAQNARLRAALERLDALYISEFDHEDRPPRPQWLQEALNGEEAK